MMNSDKPADFYASHQRRSPPFLAKSIPYIPLATADLERIERIADIDAQTQQEIEGHNQSRCRRCCHSVRLRRVVISVVVSLVLILGALTMSMTFCAPGKGMAWLGRVSGTWLGETSDATLNSAPLTPMDVPESAIDVHRKQPAPVVTPGLASDNSASLDPFLSSTPPTFAAKGSVKRQIPVLPLNGAFTKKKLYLIVLFVGLFFLCGLAFMLMPAAVVARSKILGAALATFAHTVELLHASKAYPAPFVCAA